jgi:hypothetical protein
MEYYGQSEPPDYNLRNITAPMSLHYGTGDLLVSLEVSQTLPASYELLHSKKQYGSMMSSQESSVSIVTRLWAGQLRDQGLISISCRRFFSSP